jgi:hypothetical protein
MERTVITEILQAAKLEIGKSPVVFSKTTATTALVYCTKRDPCES